MTYICHGNCVQKLVQAMQVVETNKYTYKFTRQTYPVERKHAVRIQKNVIANLTTKRRKKRKTSVMIDGWWMTKSVDAARLTASVHHHLLQLDRMFSLSLKLLFYAIAAAFHPSIFRISAAVSRRVIAWITRGVRILNHTNQRPRLSANWFNLRRRY